MKHTFIYLALLLSVSGAWALDDDECLFCHGDPDLTATHDDGTVRSVYIDEAVYEASIHGTEGCVSCHSDIEELPHPTDLKPADCGSCHTELEEYAKSTHGQRLGDGDADIGGCAD